MASATSNSKRKAAEAKIDVSIQTEWYARWGHDMPNIGQRIRFHYHVHRQEKVGAGTVESYSAVFSDDGMRIHLIVPDEVNGVPFYVEGDEVIVGETKVVEVPVGDGYGG